MKCSVCHADLSADDAVLITIKVPTRIKGKNDLVMPSAPVEVRTSDIDGEEGIECAECGAIITKRLAFVSKT